ncbi:alpha/beta fold hydrolase [Nonomuraea salmonea]|uniref:alpha/beta fold hydrolase n=1 Tax=Nonomuraea salmonea TaxID=46181 RepID=UPI002FE89915
MLKPLTLTLALLTTALAGPASAATADPPSSLTWKPCPQGGMECADVPVPVDWAKPDGRKITLKVGRLKATGAPKGQVLVAYGGPGAPGIAMTQQLSGWWTKLRRTMDVITWDTRGYGEQFQGLSTGLPCAWTRIPIAGVPRDDADFGRLSDTNRGYAEACRLKDPELFANMSSADHARDMEAIRKALGADKLNYYGASYAGFFGQAYARLHPGRVRTMVLDGTLNHSTADWSRELEATARSNEQSMRRFFTWCASNGCKDVPALWRRLITRADRTPIPTGTANVAYRAIDLQSFALGLARQGAPAWQGLAEAIRKAAKGDASGFVPARGARYPDQATPVTECTDWPRPATRKELTTTLARLRKVAPRHGRRQHLALGHPQLHRLAGPRHQPAGRPPQGPPAAAGRGRLERVRLDPTRPVPGPRQRRHPLRRPRPHPLRHQCLRPRPHRHLPDDGHPPPEEHEMLRGRL